MIGLVLAALLSQAPAALPDIEIGRANWASMQPLRTDLQLPNARLITKVQSILRSGACTLPGQRASRFDFTVNYAVRFDEARQVERVVVEDVGCELIETLVGNMVTRMIEEDLFRLPAAREDRWFTHAINFNLVA